MAQTLSAFKGKFGSTEFWIVTMKAGELIRNLTIPKELEGWEEMSPEERFQRDINYKRVADHIAPYLAEDKDRFIGAFIVAIHNHENVEFQSLDDAGLKAPKAVPSSLMSQIGLLYLSGDEVLVPLDGQHRLAALKFAIEGKDNTGKELPFSNNTELSQDSCTVILIRNDRDKARKIFNKVNRYAKPTSKADNLITADDDYIAMISRESIVGKYIDSRLVNSVSNTVPKSSEYFTTLATIYEISLLVEESRINKKPDVSKLPPATDFKLSQSFLEDFWKEFLKIEVFEAALVDPSHTSDNKRVDLRQQNLLMRPIIQKALASAIIALTTVDYSDGSRRAVSDIVHQINSVDWSPEAELWQGIAMIGDKVITGNSAMNFASRVFAYLLGMPLDEIELKKLKESMLSNSGKPLPNRMFVN